jgi:hypothetical protein
MGVLDALHMAKFLASHTYSKASEASGKLAIDGQILAKDFSKADSVGIDNEDYLKDLINLASGGKHSVSGGARGIQFFIIKGGGEGFLSSFYAGKDASRIVLTGPTTSGKPGTTMTFDDNDLLAAFDKTGHLINSALLRRPISIVNPNIWTEHTANLVYDAWDGQSVSLYRNTNFDIKYFGLWIDDSRGWYRSGHVRVDLHKREATNGCVFILDPNTPAFAETAKLNAFEPQFIKDIQAIVDAKTKENIGRMHMITIK